MNDTNEFRSYSWLKNKSWAEVSIKEKKDNAFSIEYFLWIASGYRPRNDVSKDFLNNIISFFKQIYPGFIVFWRRNRAVLQSKKTNIWTKMIAAPEGTFK